VPLRRVAARALPGFERGSGGFFYIGRIWVGQPEPQEMDVLFDTASGHTLLPGAACDNTACREHRRYSRSASASAEDVNLDGTAVQPPTAGRTSDREGLVVDFSQVDLGPGQIEGGVVREAVCLAPSFSAAPPPEALPCVRLGIVVADRMESVPFRAMPHDGIVGLGLAGLHAHASMSLLEQLASSVGSPAPVFSISLSGSAGELRFGDQSGAAGPPGTVVEWFPVARPEQGYWQVAIRAVRVGNRTFDACAAGCRGILDTGASRLGVPAHLSTRLSAALFAIPDRSGSGCRGPDLHLDLGGTAGVRAALTLRAEDYADPTCTPQLAALEDLAEDPGFAGVFVLGETVLRRYRAFFDWGALRIGFSPNTGRFVRIGQPADAVQDPASLMVL